MTLNKRHFPESTVFSFGLNCLTPDEFLLTQYDRDGQRLLRRLQEQAVACRISFAQLVSKYVESAPAFVRAIAAGAPNT